MGASPPGQVPGKEVAGSENLSPCSLGEHLIPPSFLQEETESRGLSQVTQETGDRAGTQDLGARRSPCPTALQSKLSGVAWWLSRLRA